MTSRSYCSAGRSWSWTTRCAPKAKLDRQSTSGSMAAATSSMRQPVAAYCMKGAMKLKDRLWSTTGPARISTNAKT